MLKGFQIHLNNNFPLPLPLLLPPLPTLSLILPSPLFTLHSSPALASLLYESQDDSY